MSLFHPFRPPYCLSQKAKPQSTYTVRPSSFENDMALLYTFALCSCKGTISLPCNCNASSGLTNKRTDIIIHNDLFYIQLDYLGLPDLEV